MIAEGIINKFGFGGAVTLPEGEMLEKYATEVCELQRAKLVEIGSYTGSSTAYICTGIRNIKHTFFSEFTAIDTFMASSPELDHLPTFDIFRKNLEDAGLINFVTPLRCSSMEGVKFFEDDTLDFIFIDGSHELDDVIDDFKHWIPKVKMGSLIAVHDTNLFEGVTYALNQFETQLELIDGVDTLKVYRRK